MNPDCRLGINAMDRMINDMMAFGTNRRRLKARIFGGASILMNNAKLNGDNIEFARAYLKIEKFPSLLNTWEETPQDLSEHFR
ncbi:hypothetical protein [Kosmotoga sp. DU53]|uniref:hypothetical protein n=1 Tax=Kosmotoga sp. DU53 TaxID=1310160 RepID=UPI0007C58099|nr:hypothetical protein [Kosmotoga sp. DU53]OAA21230.1 hypothetical protein DU53_06420 [Kosmotoga sp. DU53]